MFRPLITVLTLLIDFELVFISAYVLSLRPRKAYHWIFTGFCLSILLNFTDGIFILQSRYFDYQQLAFIGNNFSLLFGPLLYFFTRSLLDRTFRFKILFLFHLIPFFLGLLLTLYWYQFQPPAVQIIILERARAVQNSPKATLVGGLAVYAQYITYSFFSWQLIGRHEKSNSDYFSAVRQVRLKWLKSTISFFSVVLSFAFFYGYLAAQFAYSLLPAALVCLALSLLIFIIRLVMKGLSEPAIFRVSTEATAVVSKTSTKYSKSSLNSADKELYFQHIRQYMSDHKPYLEPELRLDQLALFLKMKPLDLSQVLNECFDQTFFDFINQYRVQEACRLLVNPKGEQMTIQQILYQVGFNSKSSFNTLFKKYTGFTPTGYKTAFPNTISPS